MTLADIWKTVLLALSSSSPINYISYQYTTIGKYCNLFAKWCQLAWDTMEARFIHFLIAKWALHSAWFYQQGNDTNVHLRGLIDAISKHKSYSHVILWRMPQLNFQKACWTHQVERENNFPAGLTWVERHNLIGWFVCQKKISLDESTESLDNIQLCYNSYSIKYIIPCKPSESDHDYITVWVNYFMKTANLVISWFHVRLCSLKSTT